MDKINPKEPVGYYKSKEEIPLEKIVLQVRIAISQDKKIGPLFTFLVISNRGITPTEFWQSWCMVTAYMLIASGISIRVYENFVKGRKEKIERYA